LLLFVDEIAHADAADLRELERALALEPYAAELTEMLDQVQAMWERRPRSDSPATRLRRLEVRHRPSR
jgi:hypothetical protein